MRNTIIETHGFCYKITNKINGKVYVGKSVKSFSNVIQRHYRNAMLKGKKTKIYDAIREYGFQNFKFEIIYDNVSKNMLDVAEMCAIYTNDALDDGNLNSTTGGTGGDVHTESMKSNKK